jgi:ribosomal protein L18E
MRKNVRFNCGIYNKKAVQKSVLAFAHLAKFIVKDSKDYIEVKISNIDNEVEDVFIDEFKNYALGAVKKCL